LNYRSINFREAVAERRLTWLGRRDLLHVAAHRFGFSRLDATFYSFNPSNIGAMRSRRVGSIIVYCQPRADIGGTSGGLRELREIAALRKFHLVDGLELTAVHDVNAPAIRQARA